MPRDKSKPGKGAFWSIDQTVGEMFEKGNYRRRKRRARLVMEKMMMEEMTVNRMLGEEKTSKTTSVHSHSIERILSM